MLPIYDIIPVADVAAAFSEGLATDARMLRSLISYDAEGIRRDSAARGIRADWKMPKDPALLGSSVKVEKGEAQGWTTRILYLSPARESGRNLCPFAGQCAAVCLGHSSGRMRFNGVRNSRLWKTALLLTRPEWFVQLLSREIAAAIVGNNNKRMLAFRLDGTSDIGLGAALAPLFARTFSLFRGSFMFYDYTKDSQRAIRARADSLPIHYTFSASERDDGHQARLHGINVATVFRSRDQFPSDAIDGDAHDLRFLDPHSDHGRIVALKLKGAHKEGTLRAARGFAL
jgi:hypothetical protein